MSKLSEFLATTTANSEDDVANLLRIMDPKDSTEEELGEAFNSELGYNPITYFDEKTIDESFETLIEGMKNSQTAMSIINSRRIEIEKDVLDYLNDSKMFTIVEGFEHVIEPLLNDEDTKLFRKQIKEAFGIDIINNDDDSSITIDEEEESIDEYTDEDDDLDDGVDVDDYDMND